MPDKQLYYVGSSNLDKYLKMRRIIYRYATEHPKQYVQKLQYGRKHYGCSVLLSKEELNKVRRDIAWIDIPETVKDTMFRGLYRNENMIKPIQGGIK